MLLLGQLLRRHQVIALDLEQRVIVIDIILRHQRCHLIALVIQLAGAGLPDNVLRE